MYICDEYGCVPRPVKELKGFIRMTLQPGETRRITFHLPVDQLAFYDEEMKLVVEAWHDQGDGGRFFGGYPLRRAASRSSVRQNPGQGPAVRLPG